MLDVLWWVRNFQNENPKKLVSMNRYKSSRRVKPAVVLGFLCTVDAVLHDFGTQQISRFLRASMVSRAYASKKGQLKGQVAFQFHDCIVTVTLVSGGLALQLLESDSRKAESPLVNMTTSTIFDVLIFSAYWYSTTAYKKYLTVPQIYHSCTLICFCV